MTLQEAKVRIDAGEASIIVIKEGQQVYETQGNGVAPLLRIVQTDKDILKGATVVDRIVGKAAATVFTLCGAKEVYALTLSKAGKAYLEKHGIAVDCGSCIEMIENRQRNGMCPFENAVKNIEDPEEAYKAISETLKNLMKNADKPA